MDARYVDLHLHTTRSDGRWDPRRVVWEAAERGLDAIAVTDHDVVGGLAEAADAADRAGIDLLPGIELTADWDGRTVHVLGYGIDPRNHDLAAALQRGKRRMAEHVERVRDALAAAGEPIAATDLTRYRARYASGAALVLAMVERGVLRRARNGRDLLRLASLEPRAYTALEAIDLIHRAGGVAVLAHPATIRPAGRSERPTSPETLHGGAQPPGRHLHGAADLKALVDGGLDGLEVWQIVHGAREREHYAAVAKELGLLSTGGSDCHGPRRAFGPRMGTQRVPYAVFEALKLAIATRAGRVDERG